MPDTKITALTAIGANPIIPSTFPIPMVDLTDTSMAASGTTKKVTVNQILGAGGTATLASATITGDLTVDTNTLKVDSANNVVGIQNATPEAHALVNSALVIGNGTAARGLMFYGTSSSQQNVAFSDTASTQQGLLQYDHSVDQMKFFTSGTLQATLNSTGLGVGKSPAQKLDVNGTIQTSGYVFFTTPSASIGAGTSNSSWLEINSGTNFNIRVNGGDRFLVDTSGNCGIGVTPSAGGGCLQLKSGITFPATQVASSDANTLDDYEEGTWAIGLEFGGASTGITTNSNQGKYTKIGNQVTINGYLALSNKGSSTGNAVITGLPFLANGYTAVSLYMAQITFADVPMGFSNNGTSTIILRESTNAGVSSTLTNADFANNSEIMFNMTYFV